MGNRCATYVCDVVHMASHAEEVRVDVILTQSHACRKVIYLSSPGCLSIFAVSRVFVLNAWDTYGAFVEFL